MIKSDASQVQTRKAAAWTEAVLARIAELQHLKPGWDGYGSPPMTVRAAHIASAIIAACNDYVPEPEIVPVTGGGIGIVWTTPQGDVEIEVLPDGGVQYVVEAGEASSDGVLSRTDAPARAAAMINHL